MQVIIFYSCNSKKTIEVAAWEFRRATPRACLANFIACNDRRVPAEQDWVWRFVKESSKRTAATFEPKTARGEEVQLTPTEYARLRVLVPHAGKGLTHHQLLREVWGVSYAQETPMLRVNISNLRRKIEDDLARPRYVLTEPGVGHRLRADA